MTGGTRLVVGVMIVLGIIGSGSSCTEQAAAPESPSSSSGAGGASTTAMPAQAAEPCVAMAVDELMDQATHMYNSGYVKDALALVVRVLACRRSPIISRYAAIFACAAHDLESAKLYFGKTPAQFQSAIVERCQLEGLDVRAP